MSCRAIVNFSTGVTWNDLHYLPVLVCMCMYVCVCARPLTVSQKNLFSCCLSSFTAPISFSASLTFPSTTPSPSSRLLCFFLLESLLAQEPHLFMLLGLRCHFQLVAKNSVLKINRVDKLEKINETHRCPAGVRADFKCVQVKTTNAK